jgi:hypothetical protein
VINRLRVLVQRENLTAFAQQVNEIASISASSVEHAHAGADVPAQYLIEDINIDLPKLFLHGQSHSDTFSVDRDLTKQPLKGSAESAAST